MKIISHDCKVPRNGINFPFIDTIEMSDNEKKILKSRLRGEAKKMFNEYDILIDEYRSWFENNNIRLELYKDVLQNITGFEELNENSSKLLEQRKEEIRKAQDIQTLDDIVRDYVNWFSYSLLSTIVDRVCRKINVRPDNFREKVEKYKEELQSFCKRCIYECPMPSELPPSSKLSKYLCMKVHMHDKYINVKAEEIMEFQEQLSKALDLSEHTLCLKSVDKGCVEVLFSIPTSIHATLFPLQSDKLNKLALLRVIKICTDGYVIEELDRYSQHSHQGTEKVFLLMNMHNYTI